MGTLKISSSDFFMYTYIKIYVAAITIINLYKLSIILYIVIIMYLFYSLE